MRTKRTGKASRAPGRSADDGWGSLGQRGMGYGGSTLLPPFLAKTYDMVADPATDTVVSWAPAGGSFVVRDTAELYTDLLPKYFKHNSMLKFIRQLITYGFRFRKVDHGLLEFAREGFVRGHIHKQIERRGSSHGCGYSRKEFKELTEEIKVLTEEMMVTKDLMSMLTGELKLIVERLRERPQVDDVDIHVSAPSTPELAAEVLWAQDSSEVDYSCSSSSDESWSNIFSS